MVSAKLGLVVLMLCGMLSSASAQETLTVSPVEIVPGDEAVVTVGYESTVARSSMQMNITLPKGLEFVAGEETGKCITLGDAAADHIVTEVAESATEVRVLAFSMTSTPFAGGKTLLSFVVKATDELEAESQIEFSNLKFAGGEYIEGLTGDVTRVMGRFGVLSVSPDTAEVQKSLGEIVLTMSAPVGGITDGAKAVVTKDGEVVAEPRIVTDGVEAGAEVKIVFDSELTGNGTYVVTVPEGVIFDEKYDADNLLMSGTRCNDEIVIEYEVYVASSIAGVGADVAGESRVYTIGGTRVEGKTGKGIYIINGKKVVNGK